MKSKDVNIRLNTPAMTYATPLQVRYHELYISCSSFMTIQGEFDDKAMEILQRSSYVRKINENGYLKMHGESSCHRSFKSERLNRICWIGPVSSTKQYYLNA